MASRIGFKKAENDGKIRAQIFFEKTLPSASIDEKYIDVLKRGDDRTSDPDNIPCSFLTGLIIDSKEYRVRLVNTDHLIKSGYVVCDTLRDSSDQEPYSKIYLTKISQSSQDLDLPTKVGYILENVIHCDPCDSGVPVTKNRESNGPKVTYTTRAPPTTSNTPNRWG